MSFAIDELYQQYIDRDTDALCRKAKLVADTANDLPTNSATEVWLMGCTGIAINTGVLYMIDSAGIWHAQTDISGVEIIPQAVWDTYTTEQKQSYGLIAIQTADTGYNRGILVNGADYDDYYDFTLIDSGWAATTKSYTFDTSGTYKLIVIALNSEASTKSLTASSTLNSTPVSGTVIDHNDSHHGTPPNERNYTITEFEIAATIGDILDISVLIENSYSSFVYAIMDTGIDTVSKSLTTADAITSGSYADDAIVMYGTFSGNTGGTINISHYSANDVITTDNPGYGYRSSYIFWFTV